MSAYQVHTNFNPVVELPYYDVRKAFEVAEDQFREWFNDQNDMSAYAVNLELTGTKMQSTDFGDERKWVFTFKGSSK